MGAGAVGRIAALAAAVMLAVMMWVTAWAGPAAAKTRNPCKVLKASEIAAEFDGASVADPQPGLKTAVSAGCTWEVAATAVTPDGDVTVSLMTTGAKPAYAGMKKMDGIETVSGRSRTLYMPSTGALMTLDGSTLITVQGVFLEGPPIRQVDVRDRLLPLLDLAQQRV
jgi:hypothetical protein